MGKYRQNPPESIPALMYHAKVYVAADKYQVMQLKQIASNNFRRYALVMLKERNALSKKEDTNSPDYDAKVAEARIAECDRLIRECMQVTDFVYDNTQRFDRHAERDPLRRATAALLRKIQPMVESIHRSEWFDLMTKFPDIGTEQFFEAQSRLSSVSPLINRTVPWKCDKGCMEMRVELSDPQNAKNKHTKCWDCGGSLTRVKDRLRERKLGYDDAYGYSDDDCEDCDSDEDDNDWPS